MHFALTAVMQTMATGFLSKNGAEQNDDQQCQVQPFAVPEVWKAAATQKLFAAGNAKLSEPNGTRRSQR